MLSGKVSELTLESARLQSLRLYTACLRLRHLLVSFGGTSGVGRPRLAASSRMSQLPPLSSLLHLADLLGEKGFKCWNEPGEDFKVSKVNLHKEEKGENDQRSVFSQTQRVPVPV